MLTRKNSPKKRLQELSELQRKGGVGGDGWETEMRELERQVRLSEKPKLAIWGLIVAIVAAVAGAVMEHILDIFQ